MSAEYLNIVTILMSGIIGFVMIKLLRLVNGPIYLPSVSNYVMWYYVAFFFIGSALINVNIYWDKRIYERPDILFMVWTMIMFGGILLPCGMILASWFWRNNGNLLSKGFRSWNSNISEYANNKSFFYMFVIFSVVTIMVILWYFLLLENIPIIEAFKSGVTNSMVAEYRNAATNSFPFKLYRFNLFRLFLIDFLILIAFILRKEKKYKILFILLCSFGIFSQIATYEKAPVIYLIIQLGVVYFYEDKLKLDSSKIKLFVFIALVPVLIYVSFYGYELQSAVQSVISRTCFSQLVCVFWHINYVEEYGFLGGLTLPNPANIFSFNNINLPREIMSFAFPELADKGLVGTMPTVFFAEFFVNFGYFSAALAAIAFGFITRSIDIFFMKMMSKKYDVILLCAYVMLVHHFSSYILLGGLIGIIFEPKLFLLVFVTLIFMMSKIIKIVW